MVILVASVMARRRKGAGGSKAGSKPLAKTARKVNGVPENRPNGSLVTSVVTESEESCVSQDENQHPHSCRTPVEMCSGDPIFGEPPPVTTFAIHSVPHKKFGKFRCLLQNAESHQIQNCTNLDKVEETQTDEMQMQEVVIEQVGDMREVVIGHETVDMGEAQEVVWEEEVVEETVVCEGMEIDLEENRNQMLEEADSQESDYDQMVEVKDNDYSSQDEQVMVLRDGEFDSQEMVEVTSIPHLSDSLEHPILVVKDMAYENGQDIDSTVIEVQNHEVVTSKEDFDSEDSRCAVRGIEDYGQERHAADENVEINTFMEGCPNTNRDLSVITEVATSELASSVHCGHENSARDCEENSTQSDMVGKEKNINQNRRLKSSEFYDNFEIVRDIEVKTEKCTLHVNNESTEGVKMLVSMEGDETVEVEEHLRDVKSREEEREGNSNTSPDSEDNKCADEDTERKQQTGAFRSRSGSTDTTGSESGSSCGTGVRRSSRLRSIGLMKQKSRKRNESEVVSMEKERDTTVSKVSETTESVEASAVDSASLKDSPSVKMLAPMSSPVSNPIPAIAPYEVDISKPVKVKSRWRRSSELEMGGNKNSDSDVATPPTPSISPRPIPSLGPSVSPRPVAPPAISPSRAALIPVPITTLPEASVTSTVIIPKESRDEKKELEEKETEGRLQSFIHLAENEYLTDRSTSKEAKRMVCDCFLSKEEILRGETGCGEDCLNRLLMIECGSRCTVGERCTNKSFQRQDYAKCEIFKTEKKGFGLRTLADLPVGTFVMEYVGEVVDQKEFRRRAKDYAKDKNRHYYFMALKSDAIIDATMKGSISRFINHSCDPNAETQKWTVNGELRIGFFSKRPISAGEEVTFDYQFQRYGKEAQRCHCETANCRGWIGEDPEKEKKDRKERKERELKKKKEEKRKDVKEFLDDMDLEEEIEKLSSSGLKNRAHTLTLCRLMVRAEDRESRVQLLKLIQGGEPACRRLFLDYHGLRLIWSWMMDVGTGVSDDDQDLRIEILQTLAKLPIPNKTMLQDSKVMTMVEKWLGLNASADSTSQEADRKEGTVQDEESGSEQDGSKPRSEDVVPGVELPDEDTLQGVESEKQLVDGASELAPRDAVALGRRGSESDEEGEESNMDRRQVFTELASRLVGEWSCLKEVFRIPKKERLEQMKEHEREADRGSCLDLDKEVNQDNKQSYDRHWRFRNEEKRERKRVRESPDSDRNRKGCRYEDRNLVPVPRMSKHERRQLFALKVAQEEEERRQQQEMWRQQEDHVLALGMDPNMTAAFDPQTGYPCYFDSTSGTWQSYPPQDANSLAPPEMVPSPMFNPHMTGMPNQSIPPPVVQHMPPPHPLGIPPPGVPGHGAPPHPMPPPHGVPPLGMPLPLGVPPPVVPTPLPQPGYDPGSMAVPGMPQQPPHPPYPDLHAPHEGGGIPEMILPPVGSQPVYQQQAPPTQHLYTPQQPIDPQNVPQNIPPGIPQGVPPGMPPRIPQGVPPGISPGVPPGVAPGMPQAVPQGVTQGVPPGIPSGVPQPQFHQVHPVQHPYMQPTSLPPKWKSARDSEGRLYYYHVKTRVSQWEVPQWSQMEQQQQQPPDTESSSDTSEDEEEEEEEEDESSTSEEEEEEPEQEDKVEDDDEEDEDEEPAEEKEEREEEEVKESETVAKSEAAATAATAVATAAAAAVTAVAVTAIAVTAPAVTSPAATAPAVTAPVVTATVTSVPEDPRTVLVEEGPSRATPDEPRKKERRREGLVQERIISPRREEDRTDSKKYKEIKEKLRRKKELLRARERAERAERAERSKKRHRDSKQRSSSRIAERPVTVAADTSSDAARKIKDQFRLQMAGVIVQYLNPYRKPDCKVGRIVNTEDFKHLARKLTHFVMVKELKHCRSVEDLECNDNVKHKARDFVKKYMAKFGSVYQRPKDDD